MSDEHDDRADRNPSVEGSASSPRPEDVRAVRLGHGANCSSVGSVVDMLFVGAAVGGAIVAAICAAMRDEPVRIAGNDEREDEPREPAETKS